MAAVSTAPGLPYFRFHSDSKLVSTLPDPRKESVNKPLPVNGVSKPTQHPDLSSEVTALSNKLINAINHQTDLDDSLADARHELEASRDRIRQLEVEVQEHKDMLTSGEWTKTSDIDIETIQLRTQIEEEQKARTIAEKEKKAMEQELESLTGALFEEANEMVSAARKERDAMEKKNEQLKSQLNDTEFLLTSHQEQLMELKTVMQQMGSDRDEMEANTNISTAPSTPGMAMRESRDILEKQMEAANLSPHTPSIDQIPPDCPTSFSHLIHPVLRTDLQSFGDFKSLLHMGRESASHSRVNSGSLGLNVLGMGTFAGGSSTVLPTNNGSNSSLSTMGTNHSAPGTPITPASSISNHSAREVFSAPPLKETRFYKRVLTEDIEPTLRLDTAPGLSWLARRAVLNSMSDGSLLIEPMPAMTQAYGQPCSLCGESRKSEDYIRRHRFRTNENDKTAQRHPLCGYCLSRMRACCDFLGFLRMLKDGHWRAEGEGGEMGAWEESVRLREKMFWAKIGGGVVPAFIHTRDSPRISSTEEREKEKRMVLENEPAVDGEKLQVGEPVSKEEEKEEDVFNSKAKRTSFIDQVISKRNSVSATTITQDAYAKKEASDPLPPLPVTESEASKDICGRESIESESSATETPNSRSSSQRRDSTSSKRESNLSIKIPGTFE